MSVRTSARLRKKAEDVEEEARRELASALAITHTEESTVATPGPEPPKKRAHGRRKSEGDEAPSALPGGAASAAASTLEPMPSTKRGSTRKTKSASEVKPKQEPKQEPEVASAPTVAKAPAEAATPKTRGRKSKASEPVPEATSSAADAGAPAPTPASKRGRKSKASSEPEPKPEPMPEGEATTATTTAATPAKAPRGAKPKVSKPAPEALAGQAATGADATAPDKAASTPTNKRGRKPKEAALKEAALREEAAAPATAAPTTPASQPKPRGRKAKASEPISSATPQAKRAAVQVPSEGAAEQASTPAKHGRKPKAGETATSKNGGETLTGPSHTASSHSTSTIVATSLPAGASSSSSTSAATSTNTTATTGKPAAPKPLITYTASGDRNPPPEIFEQIFYYVEHGEDLLSLASTCHSAWVAFHGLPPWLPHLLKNGHLLQQKVLLDVMRSLRIVISRKCELCGGGRVQGFHASFRIFAHDKCVEEHLRNEYYYEGKTCLSIARKLKVPYVVRSGYNPSSHKRYRIWAAIYYWEKPKPGLVEAVETMQGLEQMTEAAATKAYAELKRSRAALDEQLGPHLAVIELRAKRREQKKEQQELLAAMKKDKGLDERLAKLETKLQKEALPSVADLKARYAGYVERDEFLGAYFAPRATAPFSMKQAIERVRAMISLADREIESEDRKRRVDTALRAAGRSVFASLNAASRAALDVDSFLALRESGDKATPLTDEHIAAALDALNKHCAAVAAEARMREAKDNAEALERAAKLARLDLALLARKLSPLESLEPEMRLYLEANVKNLKSGDPAVVLQEEDLEAGIKGAIELAAVVEARIAKVAEAAKAGGVTKVVDRAMLRTSRISNYIFNTDPGAPDLTPEALADFIGRAKGSIRDQPICTCGELGAYDCVNGQCAHCCYGWSDGCERHRYNNAKTHAWRSYDRYDRYDHY